MIDEVIIQNADNVLSLIQQGIITVEEVRKMLGVQSKTPASTEVSE